MPKNLFLSSAETIFRPSTATRDHLFRIARKQMTLEDGLLKFN